MYILNWQSVITSVTELAGNHEQNQTFPPNVATNAGRLATDYILNELVRIYPNSQLIVDKARPFLKRKIVAIENGLVTLPSDYRNILDVSIAVNEAYSSPCDCSGEYMNAINLIDTCDPNNPLYDAQVASLPKEPCVFKKVAQVDTDQFDDRTRSKINKPSIDRPIYAFISPTQIKICPKDFSHVEIRYIKQPLKYNIAYELMPDDTWQIDTTSPDYVELEWEHNASPEFFRAMLSLYSLHTRDGNLNQWNNELKKGGLF
jgi:hypothetical protein